MSEHKCEIDGPIPQLCEPFDPPHWAAFCTCGRSYIWFGEEPVRRWAEQHVTEETP